MKTILHITASPRGEASESNRLSQRIVDHLLEKEPGAAVVRRNLAEGLMPHIDEDYAFSQASTSDRSDKGSMLVSENLIGELENADFVVIGTPMHNLTVPSSLKAWIDHAVRARRTFNVTSAGKVGMLKDRPVLIAIASGGRFSGERARQPDFLSPYLKTVLAMIGLHDVAFFSVQGTVSGDEAIAQARAKADFDLQEHFELAQV